MLLRNKPEVNRGKIRVASMAARGNCTACLCLTPLGEMVGMPLCHFILILYLLANLLWCSLLLHSVSQIPHRSNCRFFSVTGLATLNMLKVGLARLRPRMLKKQACF